MNFNAHTLNRVYAPILLGLGVLFAIIILRPVYSDYLDVSNQYRSQSISLEQKQKQLADLEAFAKSFTTSWSSTDTQQKIQKINQTWDSIKIMSAITLNEYTRGTAITPAPIAIGSISVDKWSRLVNGLSLGSVSFSVTANSVDQMISYITYLAKGSPFVFTLDSISLPIDTGLTDASQVPVSLWLKLWVYYFE
jgi:hypothetical protein